MRGPGRYILEGHRPVAEPDLLTWGLWLQNGDRIVARTEHELFAVSTVFLGLDHRFDGDGPPILFETIVLIEGEGRDQARYSSWDDAETGHKAMVRRQLERVRAAYPRPDSGPR